MTTLTEEQQTILDLENQRWKYQGAKDAAIRERLGWSATRYYLEMNRLIDTQAALQASPLLVKRLRRLRSRRRELWSRRGAV